MTTRGSAADVEAIHAALVEHAPDGLLVVDAAGRVVMVNAEIERLFGYVRAELLGRPVEVLLPEGLGDAHVALREAYAEAPSTRAMMHDARAAAGRHADGHELAIDVRLGPLRIGGELHVIAAIRDVRELQQRETDRRREDAAREEASYERIGERKLTETAASFGVAPLREARPVAFAELVSAYASLLDAAIERRAYRVAPASPEGVRALTERLGFLSARPRDLVEIHLAAIASKAQGSPAARASAYAEEGRFLLLEIMGGLATHYRKLSLGRGT